MATATKTGGRPKGRKTQRRPTDASRIIEAGKAYPVTLFRQITRMGRKGWLEARQRDLPVRVAADRTMFVVGEEFLDWLKGQPKV